MARIFAGLLAVIAGWLLWWPVAAWREDEATRAWLDARRAEGWQAEAMDVAVSGFPLAYNRDIRGIALADPSTGWAWQADAVSLARPRHPQISEPGFVLTLPQTQEIQTPERRLTIASERLVATLVPGPEGEVLASAEVEMSNVDVASGDDWRAALASGTLTATADPNDPERVDLVLTASRLVPPATMARALSNADLAPREIERLQFEAEVTFDRPWRVAALEGPRPQPLRIALGGSGLRWGELTLRIGGTLEVDAAGRPEGELLLKATNWRDLLAAAVASGAVPEGLSGGLEAALELASRLAGSPATLDIPVTFSGGRVRIGPVPVGRAPVLRLP